jgi:hypothetical protein
VQPPAAFRIAWAKVRTDCRAIRRCSDLCVVTSSPRDFRSSKSFNSIWVPGWRCRGGVVGSGGAAQGHRRQQVETA